MIIYIVQPGDSVSAIANRFGVSVQDILEHNWVRDDLRIWPGQFLFIPRGDHHGGHQGDHDWSSMDESNLYSMLKPVIRRYAFYEVQSGDTLTTIASRFNTTVDALVDANNLVGPQETIYPGQVLRIPIIEFVER